MAEKIVSPGVFTNEIDQSFLPATAGPIGAAIVGPTLKGPILTPTVVSSYSEYVQIFGEVFESGSDSYQYLTSHTAKEYLRQGGPATVVRVADPDSVGTRASAVVRTSDTVGTATATTSIRLMGGNSAVPSGSDEIAATLTINGIDFVAVTSASAFEDAAGSAGYYTIGTTKATFGANLVNEINAGNAGVTAALSNDTLTLTANQAGTAGNITVSTSSIGTQVGEQAQIFTASSAGFSLTGGTDATTQENCFTIEVLGDGPRFNNYTGSQGFGTDNLLPQLTSSAVNDHFSSGSFGGRADNFRYEISQRNTAKGTFTLAVRAGNDTTKKKTVLETFENLTLDPADSNYILKRIGNQTNTIAVEDGQAFLQPTGEYPNRSKNIRIKTVHTTTPNYLDENGDLTDNALSSSIPALGSGSVGGSFSGGDFGKEFAHPFKFYDEITAGNSQGIDMSESAAAVGTSTVGGGYATAVNMLKNKDEFDFNLLFLPGVIDQLSDHSTIIGNAIQMCEDRGDVFLVLDNTSKTSTVATVKSNAEARNSSYAAAYYPWVQIQDATLGTFRYVPPSVVMAGVYHFNDTVGQPWFAPAGLNRGGIDSAVQAYRKLTQGQRDDLYESNVNPIATFPGQGVTVFGQKTLQKKASALDRVNVRRLLINLKKFVAQSSRTLVFEQNTTDLRNQFLNVVNPYMEQVQANQGLNAFRVVMDDSNNTPETIDRNQLIGQIFVQPSRTAEFIVLDFVVQPTGAAFPE